MRCAEAVCGVVAAGGFATRMGWKMPKSMAVVRGRTLLAWNLLELHLAGVRRVLVFTNRPDWVPAQQAILAAFPGTELVEDKGVGSTLELVKAAITMDAERILFAYGHAPTHHRHLRKLLDTDTRVACTKVSFSSRRRPIPDSEGGFLEPPVWVDRVVSLNGTCTGWNDLLTTVGVRAVPLATPGEFNDQREFLEYSSCLSTYYDNVKTSDRGADLHLWSTTNECEKLRAVAPTCLFARDP